MVSGPDVVRPARNTRPANRRDLIVAAAGDLFYRKGYRNVGMGEVAEAVAIGPSALYRHFRGKQSLLATVIGGALRKLDDAIVAMEDPREDIATTLAASVLAGREVGVLWRREARHLSDADREQFRADVRRIGARFTELIARRRPELTPAQSDLLAWCALAAGNSVSFHSLSLPELEFTKLLGELIGAVIDAPAPVLPEECRSHTRSTPVASTSRREIILTEATELFADRGFNGVSVDDIGTASGIAGPSVYNHFSGKVEILTAAITRGDEWLRTGMQRALAGAMDPCAGLTRLLADYTEFTLENPPLIQLLISEIEHLHAADRTRARASQRAYIAEWVHLLRRLHPAFDPVAARIRVQAAQTMINDTARTPHLRAIPDLSGPLATIAGRVLALPPASKAV